MSIRYPYKGEGFRGWESRLASYDRGFLLGLYRAMLRIRIVEEEIEKRYHEDQMKTPIHLVIGQDAFVSLRDRGGGFGPLPARGPAAA